MLPTIFKNVEKFAGQIEIDLRTARSRMDILCLGGSIQLLLSSSSEGVSSSAEKSSAVMSSGFT